MVFNLFFALPLVGLCSLLAISLWLSRHSAVSCVSFGLLLSRFFEEYLWFLLYILIYVFVVPFEWFWGRVRRHAVDMPPEKSEMPVIIIIHGYLSTPSHWLLLAIFLRIKGYSDVIRFGYSPFSGSLNEWSGMLKEKIKSIHNRRVILIGHSMGGLIALWTASGFRSGVITKVITMGSPFKGTQIARHAITKSARELIPGTEAIKRTGSIIEGLKTELTCFWSSSDLLMIPPESASHEKGQSTKIDGMGHTGYHFWCLKGAPELLKAINS